MKKQAKITYEILRKDAVYAADLLATEIETDFARRGIDPKQRAALMTLVLMLKGATHIVIHDSNTLPED